MNDIKFSIVTVAYNSEKTIGRTIEHVLEQTYNNYEYIIIDGESKDNTVGVAESYKDKFQEKGINYSIISEKDNGIYDAMNKGIKLSKGDFVGMVNSDDYYELDCLETVVNEYQKETFDICYGNLRMFDEKSSFIKTAKAGKKFDRLHWNHPTMFVKRSIYDEKLYACENLHDDLDFILWCFAQNKFKINAINKVLSNFQFGGISNERVWKKSMQRVKLCNSIYKQNGMKGYALKNFLIELVKYLRG